MVTVMDIITMVTTVDFMVKDMIMVIIMVIMAMVDTVVCMLRLQAIAILGKVALFHRNKRYDSLRGIAHSSLLQHVNTKQCQLSPMR